MRVLSTSVRGLEMPVDECPSGPRGACPFLCPWSTLCFCFLLHVHNKSVLLYSTAGTERTTTTNHEPRNSIVREPLESLRRQRCSTLIQYDNIQLTSDTVSCSCTVHCSLDDSYTYSR